LGQKGPPPPVGVDRKKTSNCQTVLEKQGGQLLKYPLVAPAEFGGWAKYIHLKKTLGGKGVGPNPSHAVRGTTGGRFVMAQNPRTEWKNLGGKPPKTRATKDIPPWGGGGVGLCHATGGGKLIGV